jgi:hypothetical protein
MSQTAQAPSGSAQRAAVRMTRLEGEIDAHRQVDDLRFGALAAAIGKLEAGLEALQGEVRDGFDRLTAAVQDLQLKLAASGEDAARNARTHWRIGPFAQWAMGLSALAALALIGWLATQLWLEEPARIRALAPEPPAAASR